MREINFFGIFVTPMLAYLIIAALLYFLLLYLLRKVRFEHYFWHPKMVQFFLFLILLTLVVMVALI